MRIKVTVTPQFSVLIDRYKKLYNFPSRSQALLGLAELGAGMEFGDVPAVLHDYQYLGGNYRERENIRKRKKRWVKRLQSMDQQERAAMLWAIRDAGLEDVVEHRQI